MNFFTYCKVWQQWKCQQDGQILLLWCACSNFNNYFSQCDITLSHIMDLPYFWNWKHPLSNIRDISWADDSINPGLKAHTCLMTRLYTTGWTVLTTTINPQRFQYWPLLLDHQSTYYRTAKNWKKNTFHFI